jgi:hypothetical protein
MGVLWTGRFRGNARSLGAWRAVDDRCVQSAALVTICRMTRGVRTAAVTTILLLTVAACRNGEARGSKPLPPLSSGPTPSASLSPTGEPASRGPSPTDGKDVVVAFIRDYQAEVDQAGRTGDVGRLRSLSFDSCTCRDTVEFIENAYKAGSIRGMSSTIDRVDVQFVGADEAQLVVTMRISAHDVLDSDGDVKRHIRPVKRGLISYTLRRRGADWRILSQLVVKLDR